MQRLVYGVGINDADYNVHITDYDTSTKKLRIIWRCPFYTKWTGMLLRCYSDSDRNKNPSYVNCVVCEDWKYFSNFKDWMETQDWEGKELDKDLLVRNNKVYSPETCIFLTKKVNSFMIARKSKRGPYKIGVNWSKSKNKFEAYCSKLNGKQEYLGSFNTEEEAHQAWLSCKLKLAKMLAAEQDDPRVAKALVERYENYQPD